MSAPEGNEPGTERAYLINLALHSEKALQQGQELCSVARTRSVESVQAAVDLLAINAKVRWIVDAVSEQLKVAANVVKTIERRRSQLEAQAKEFDVIRNEQTAALDSVLDSLGSQLVPAEFYSTSPESSLFGSQLSSDDEEDHPPGGPQPSQSPTETLRDVLRNGVSRNWKIKQKDRSTWKSLRDFVSERSIEDIFDDLESGRNMLDDIMAKTSDFPESLTGTIQAIGGSLPTEISIPPMDDIFASQESLSVDMANHLSSLTSHYDQMVQALHDYELGEEFTEADLQQMNRDVDELPAIIADLERSTTSINESHGQLTSAKRSAEAQLDSHRARLDDLDELADIMSEMLDRQYAVEVECNAQLSQLSTRVAEMEGLKERYTSYQFSYSKLVVELDRRRTYQKTTQKIVEGMREKLRLMVDEERQRMSDFQRTYGENIPDDLCLFAENPPTEWELQPANHQPIEALPDIDQDLLQEALRRIAASGVSGNPISTINTIDSL